MRLEWRHWARKTVTGLLFYGHVIDLLQGSRSGRRVILAYHRVLPKGSADLAFVQPGMYVTADTFEMHIRHLLAHYRVVPLEDLISMPEGDACAITFDDGWRDNYLTAFPILRRHKVPATMFLATSLVGATRWPWPDRICFYIHRDSPAVFSTVFKAAWRDEVREPIEIAISSDDAVEAAEQVLGRLKQLQHGLLKRVVARIDYSFNDLDSALHAQRPWLTWDQVVEMGNHGISFGAHTESHVILTSLAPSEARAEIVNSGKMIAERLGKPTTAFCYPNGAYDSDIVGLVADAGYRCAVTTRSGPLERSAGPFELNRIMMHDDISSTKPMFACTLAGLSAFGQLAPFRIIGHC